MYNNKDINILIVESIVKKDPESLQEILVTRQPNLNNLQFAGSNYNVLKEAIKNGLYDIVKTLLNYTPEDPAFKIKLNESDLTHDGCSPLSLAVAYGQIEIVELLLDYGASPFDARALHNAVNQENTKIAEILLALGGTPNQIADYYYSEQGYFLKEAALIHIAITSSNPLPMIALLVAYGADINSKVKYLISDGKEIYNTYEYTALEFYTFLNKGGAEDLNSAVEIGLQIKKDFLSPPDPAHLDNQVAITPSEASDNTDNQQSALQHESHSKTERGIMPETIYTSNEDKSKEQKNIKNTNDSENDIFNIVLNQFLSWLQNLPEWLQNYIQDTSPIKTLTEHNEHISTIYSHKLCTKLYTKNDISGQKNNTIESSIHEKITISYQDTIDAIDMSLVSKEPLVTGWILPTNIESGIIAGGKIAFDELAYNPIYL